MTSQEFASVYEAYSDAARKVVMWKFRGNQFLADEAVQAASEYFLMRLSRLEKITESFFIRHVLNKAQDITKMQTRQYMRVLPQGIGRDLEIVEEQELEKHIGRKFDPNSRYDEDNQAYNN